MTLARTLLVASLSLVACGPKTPPPETTPPSDTTPPGDTTPSDTAGATTETPPAGPECKPTGCSGTVCSDQDVTTTCEFRPEYACYAKAECTRQPDGACGWTKSAELDACLANPPQQP